VIELAVSEIFFSRFDSVDIIFGEVPVTVVVVLSTTDDTGPLLPPPGSVGSVSVWADAVADPVRTPIPRPNAVAQAAIRCVCRPVRDRLVLLIV
jgi:hypothetical protein